MKYLAVLLVLMVSFSSNADEKDKVAKAISDDIQNQVDDAVKNEGKDIKMGPDSQGKVLFVIAPISNTADKVIVHFQNIVACTMPTAENPIVLLDAYETDDLNSSRITIEGTTSGAKFNIGLNDGRNFSHANKKITTNSESLPTYLLTPSVNGETYAISGSYLCPK